jgi:hypothetical protein
MKLTASVVLIGLLVSTASFAQSSGDKGVEVKKQTANSGPQKVVETPATRKKEADQKWTDGVNTKRHPSTDTRPRDEYGVPVPQPISGQGTNSSTDAMRAADKKH